MTDQDRQMRQVLAELELISHGTTSTWGASGGDADRDPRPRGGDLHPPHDTHRAHYAAALTDTDRDHAIREARAELHAIRVRQAREVREESPAEFDTRARRALADGWTVEQVATAMRVTPTRIRRAQAGASELQVQALAKDGMTVRGIAMRLGLSKSEVHRMLKRAA